MSSALAVARNSGGTLRTARACFRPAGGGYSAASRRPGPARAPHSNPVARMSSPSNVADSPITHRDQLVEYIASGGKPKADWRIGTEHEKFGFRLDDLRPPTFDGERGIEALLKGLTGFGWEEVREQVDDAPPRTIALLKEGASVTLEPAGQLELSGAPLLRVHDTCSEVDT